MPTTAQEADVRLNSRSIPLDDIAPSKTNPGRSFSQDRDADLDLVESIRIHGVLEPLLLRPSIVTNRTAERYEIVAGERRFHCAIKAGLKFVPALVRELSDAQALEIQIIENDQREDLDPLAKAAAYRRLWDAYTAADTESAETRMDQMAERLGRKPRTVYNILALGNLIPQGQKLMREGTITQSHAYEICRRPPAEQKKIVEWVEDETMYEGRAPSVRDLKGYIRDACDHFLDAAPFDKKDPVLIPRAGACTVCPKNSAVNPNLVDPEDAKGKRGGKRSICTDSECYEKKVAAHLVQIEKQAKKNPPASQAAKPEGGYVRVNSMPRTPAQKKAMLKKQRDKKLDQAYRALATAELRKRVTTLSAQDLKDVAMCMVNQLDRRHRNPVFSAMGWKTSNSCYGPPIPTKKVAALQPKDVAAFIALMTLASQVLPGLEGWWPNTHVALQPFAKRHQVNLAKIHAQAAKPLQAKWRAIDAKKKKTAKAHAGKKTAAGKTAGKTAGKKASAHV